MHHKTKTKIREGQFIDVGDIIDVENVLLFYQFSHLCARTFYKGSQDKDWDLTFFRIAYTKCTTLTIPVMDIHFKVVLVFRQLVECFTLNPNVTVSNSSMSTSYPIYQRLAGQCPFATQTTLSTAKSVAIDIAGWKREWCSPKYSQLRLRCRVLWARLCAVSVPSVFVNKEPNRSRNTSWGGHWWGDFSTHSAVKMCMRSLGFAFMRSCDMHHNLMSMAATDVWVPWGEDKTQVRLMIVESRWDCCARKQ